MKIERHGYYIMAQMAHIKLDDSMQIENAILPGDPARIDRICEYLDDVEMLAFNREFKSVKGFYKGVPVLAVSTGIGGPSTGIVVEELSKIGVKRMIRIGSCGALQKGMYVGDLVLSQAVVRDDGTSRAYIDQTYPAVADFALLTACKTAADCNKIPYHLGITRSHDSFYTDHKEEIYTHWKKRGILASDMETASMYVVGMLRGIQCASILNVVVESEDNLEEQINQYTLGENKAVLGEKNEILVALEALSNMTKSNH